MGIDQYDENRIYCRLLGHEVPFSYCRQGALMQPCRRIFDCWFEVFDIDQYMQAYYTENQIKDINVPQKPKMATLVELIRQAQKNASKE
jgi:hypothetical protein